MQSNRECFYFSRCETFFNYSQGEIVSNTLLAVITCRKRCRVGLRAVLDFTCRFDRTASTRNDRRLAFDDDVTVYYLLLLLYVLHTIIVRCRC